MLANMGFLYRHLLLTFVLLGLSFLMFGAATVNLAILLNLNIHLWLDVGWQAAMDGALSQLLQLLGLGYAAMLMYIVFKCCERVLVESLTRRHDN